jgi:hypothetical protein
LKNGRKTFFNGLLAFRGLLLIGVIESSLFHGAEASAFVTERFAPGARPLIDAAGRIGQRASRIDVMHGLHDFVPWFEGHRTTPAPHQSDRLGFGEL